MCMLSKHFGELFYLCKTYKIYKINTRHVPNDIKFYGVPNYSEKIKALHSQIDEVIALENTSGQENVEFTPELLHLMAREQKPH